MKLEINYENHDYYKNKWNINKNENRRHGFIESVFE